MPKEFLLAFVRPNGTRWNVELSNRRDAEIFVSKGGALGWIEKAVAVEQPVQALVYRPGGAGLEEAFFFERGTKRKLNILTDAAKTSELSL